MVLIFDVFPETLSTRVVEFELSYMPTFVSSCALNLSLSLYDLCGMSVHSTLLRDCEIELKNKVQNLIIIITQHTPMIFFFRLMILLGFNST